VINIAWSRDLASTRRSGVRTPGCKASGRGSIPTAEASEELMQAGMIA
jgi:hypothetical protein